MFCVTSFGTRKPIWTLILLFAFSISFTSCDDDSMDLNLFVKSLGTTQQFSEIDRNSFVILDNGDIVTAINAFSPDDPANTSVEALGIYVLKMDAKGEVIWEKYFIGGKVRRCSEMIQTRDGGFLITGAQSEGEDYYDFTATYLMKISAEGDLIWEQTYSPGNNAVGLEIAEKSNGEIVLFTRVGAPVVFHLDRNGNQIEAFVPDGGGWTMLLTSDEKTLIGSSSISLFEGSQMLWQYEFSDLSQNFGRIINDVIETPEGDFVGFGYQYSNLDNTSNYFAVKLSSEGELIWQKIYEEPQNNSGEEIVQTTAGNFITLGINESNIGSTLRLRTIDANGEELSIQLLEFANETRVIASDLQLVNDQYFAVLGAGFNIAGNSSSLTQYYKQFSIEE